MNLKYVLFPPGAQSPGPKFTLVYDGPDGRIYRNSRVFPRAFLVASFRNCVDDAAALALIRGGQINLREEVLIAGCTRDFASAPSIDATAEVQRYEPERVVLHADIRSPAFLVLSDTYDAGWRVSVDGREAPLLRADYAFRAVAPAPGFSQSGVLVSACDGLGWLAPRSCRAARSVGTSPICELLSRVHPIYHLKLLQPLFRISEQDRVDTCELCSSDAARREIKDESSGRAADGELAPGLAPHMDQVPMQSRLRG